MILVKDYATKFSCHRNTAGKIYRKDLRLLRRYKDRSYIFFGKITDRGFKRLYGISFAEF